jgi:hypothetical protein
VFDSNGLTRVIDPDERNVLVCETVSSRRYSGQSLLCNALWAALSRRHFKDVTILVNVPSDDKTCRGELDTLKSFKKVLSG